MGVDFLLERLGVLALGSGDFAGVLAGVLAGVFWTFAGLLAGVFFGVGLADAGFTGVRLLDLDFLLDAGDFVVDFGSALSATGLAGVFFTLPGLDLTGDTSTRDFRADIVYIIYILKIN